VTELVAVEPEAYLRERARQAAAQAPVPVSVVDGLGGALPFEDAAFDAGVASLVLCSVPDQDTVLRDLYRVIRPGGQLRFYEHVRADSPGQARFQELVARVWPFFAGGCHPNRDTAAAIERTGFVVESCHRFRFRPLLICAPVAPRILGTARRVPPS
jgi:ubiquinone/menaquinone biosynthesis C-methylase UbiE